MKKLLIMIAAASCISLTAAEAEPAAVKADDSQLRTELASRMIDAMKLEKQIGRALDMSRNMQIRQITQAVKRDAPEKADEIVKKITALLDQAMSWNSLKPVIVKSYADMFDAETLKAGAEFYESAAGQKLSDSNTKLQQKIGMAVQQNMMKVMPKIQALLQQAKPKPVPVPVAPAVKPEAPVKAEPAKTEAPAEAETK